MIAIDFRDWFAYHIAAFPAVDGWLTKFPDTPRREGEPTQGAVLGSWSRTLADVDLKFAKLATDLLAKGQEEFFDRSFDCHPRTVRHIAMKLAGTARKAAKQRTLDGEEIFDCGYCRDTGIVEVYVPRFLEWAADAFPPGLASKPGERLAWQRSPTLQERPAGIPFSCSIACTCARGGPKAKNLRGYVFDKETHVPYDPFRFFEAVERMREVVASRGGF